MIYLDSSIVLDQILVEGRRRILGTGDVYTSEITELECLRTIDRLRIRDRLPDEVISAYHVSLRKLLKSFKVIHLDRTVLKRATAAFPTVVRSLDAIHLASAELAGASTFLTLDKQQSVAAKALGFSVDI